MNVLEGTIINGLDGTIINALEGTIMNGLEGILSMAWKVHYQLPGRYIITDLKGTISYQAYMT